MRIPVAAVPPSSTVFAHLAKQTRYHSGRRRVSSPLCDRKKIELDLVDVDLPRLLASVLEIVQIYGMGGWRSSGGESKTYGGFSLTYNPNHQDGIDPHVSTLGTPKNAASEFFWNKIEKHEVLLHSYFDTYGFRARTPASKHGYLGEFIDSFTLPLIRSRVGIIVGEQVNAEDPEYQANAGWHRDELVTENLRVNIPLQSDENYVFQMEGDEPYHLEVGTAYTWDTNKAHRVIARRSTKTTRVHLVLGFSPWFDFDPVSDTFSPNRFMGTMHPFDMVASGIVSPHLRLRES